MLNKFYQSLEQFKLEHKFVRDLIRSHAFETAIRLWEAIKVRLYSGPNMVKFFAPNTDKVATITNMLADEKSKIVYNGNINFRQSGRKKDYPHGNCDKLQYFINEIKFSPNEVFVDCGAFDGDTIEDFLKYCPEYKQIVAFEPEPANFQKLQAKHQSNPKVMLINAGAWHEDGIVSFAGSEVSGTIIAGGGDLSEAPAPQRNLSEASRIKREVSISVKSIDSIGLDAVTFIKMDIEGAELNALKGAKNTIQRDKPKLAICIYHKPEDMFEIPEYIHELVPEYKFYVRLHKSYPYLHETVLYAML